VKRKFGGILKMETTKEGIRKNSLILEIDRGVFLFMIE
jgi:hypothetical protein